MTITDVSPWTLKEQGYTDEQILEREQELELHGRHLFDWASYAWLKGFPITYQMDSCALMDPQSSFYDWESPVRKDFDIPNALSVSGIVEMLRPAQKEAILLKYRSLLSTEGAASRMRCSVKSYNNTLQDAAFAIKRICHPAEYAEERRTYVELLGEILQLEIRDKRCVQESYNKLKSIQRDILKRIAIDGEAHEVVASSLRMNAYDVLREYNRAVEHMRKHCSSSNENHWSTKMLADCGIPRVPNVNELLSQLPTFHRRLLLAYYRDGDNGKALSAKFGFSVSNISYNMNNAKRYLHTIYRVLKEEGEPPTEWFRQILVKMDIPVTSTSLKAWCALDFDQYKIARQSKLSTGASIGLRKSCKRLEELCHD